MTVRYIYVQFPTQSCNRTRITGGAKTKNPTESKKNKIPKAFLRKIKELGLRDEDARTLFDSKIDWTAVYADDKIYCTEKGCDFATKIEGDELKNHGRLVHKYGEYPCRDEFCSYVGYSQKNVNLHFKVHTMRSIKRFANKCPISKCHSTFGSLHELEKHLRIHNNDLHQCQFCAFRFIHETNYKIHLKVRDFDGKDIIS